MDSQDPVFSIVVPTYNRPRQLRNLLAGLCEADYPRDRFEVIVVDDGGASRLDDVARPFHERLDLRVLSCSHRGPSGARQVGTRAARGRYLAFTDDDCVPEADWLTRLGDALDANPGCAVGGRTVNALSDNLYSEASQRLITYLYRQFNADPADARFFTTNNVAFPAQAFRAIGGLDESWSISGGEDRDLCHRWRRRGHRMVYAPDAVMHHAHALTFTSFWRQHYHYGRGGFHYHRHSATRERRRARLESAAFYLGALWAPSAGERWGRRLALAARLGVSQGATAAGYLREWARSLGGRTTPDEATSPGGAPPPLADEPRPLVDAP